MSTITYRQAATIIGSLSGKDRIIGVPITYVDLTGGDHVAALFLQQVLYWTQYTKDENGWFYKTGIEWYEELRLTYRQVSRISKLLKPIGLETKLKKHKGAPKTFYRINFDDFIPAATTFMETGFSPLVKIAKSENHERAESISTKSEKPDFNESAKSSISNSQDEAQDDLSLELEPPHPVPNLPHPATEREGEEGSEQVNNSSGDKNSSFAEEKNKPIGQPVTLVRGINSAAAFLSPENNQPKPVPTTDKLDKLSQCRNFDQARDYLENYPGEEFSGAISKELTMLNVLPWRGFKREKIFSHYDRNFVHYIAHGWSKEAPESRYADVVARLLKAERRKEVFIQICSHWELFEVEVNGNERKLKAIEKRLDKHSPQQSTQPALDTPQTPSEETQNKPPFIADDMTSVSAIQEACQLILKHGEEEFASWHPWNSRWLRTFRTSPQVKNIYAEIKQQHEQQELGAA